MKLKNLRKKIRRLEARLREGPKKLAKLKEKLESVTTARMEKPARKSADAERQSAAKKVKRKLNISPERRAQLSAAMKARWAAKRAAAKTNPQNTSIDRGSTSEQSPQTP
jgi:chromosome segregation ATPase